MKVLIVEDSVLIANAIKILLKKEGIETFYTSEGLEVPKIIPKENIDLVILDLMMPKVSGDEVLKMLKNDPKTKDVKVMILTAKTDALRWDKSLEKCDKFMTKPFDNTELVIEVKKLLNKK